MIRFFEDNQEIPVIWDLSVEDDVKYLGKYKNPMGNVTLNIFMNGGFRRYRIDLEKFSLVLPEERYYKAQVHDNGAFILMEKRFVKDFIRKMRIVLYKDCKKNAKESAAIAMMKLLFQSNLMQGTYSFNTEYPLATRKWIGMDFCVYFKKDYWAALEKCSRLDLKLISKALDIYKNGRLK